MMKQGVTAEILPGYLMLLQHVHNGTAYHTRFPRCSLFLRALNEASAAKVYAVR